MSSTRWEILIVDDDEDSSSVLTEAIQLHSSDIGIRIARLGQEGLAMLNELDPTLILVDLRLPDIDGWQMLEKIRSNPKTADIPVVAITAYHSASVAEDAIQAGFSGYFEKPIDVYTFGQELSQLMPA